MFHPKHVESFTGNKILSKKVSSCWNIFKNLFTMHGQMSIKKHIQYFKAQKTGHIVETETLGISFFRVLKITFKPNVPGENNSYVL
jgi:hypothetical protein